jgi:Kef-type K+ transport system membrane component KefB
VIRGALVLALIIGLTLAARSFPAGPSQLVGSGAALAFGFLLLAALQAGRIFHAMRLPHLTGFILCGAAFGPGALALITPEMLEDLTLVKRVAVGLIALLAGCELNVRALRPQLRSIGLLSALGVFFAILFLFAFFFALTEVLPATQGMSITERVVVALICSNTLAAFSPAVVVGIVTETRAAGRLTDLCVAIVVVADLAIILLFSLSNAIGMSVFPGAGAKLGLGPLLVHIFGSLGLGIALGAILAIYVRRVGARVGLVVFGLFFVIAQAGNALHIDPLLTGLAAGLFLENVTPVGGRAVARRTEPAALPTFAVFFAVIGAEVNVRAFLAVAAFAGAAAAVRAIAIYVGARVGGALARLDEPTSRLVPFGMFPQAGIALALANLVQGAFPWGEALGTLLVGTIVVNELIGPVLFRAALARAGELGRRTDDTLLEQAPHAAPEPSAPPVPAPIQVDAAAGESTR